MLIFIKKLLGIDDLERSTSLLERKNSWKEKYKHGQEN